MIALCVDKLVFFFILHMSLLQHNGVDLVGLKPRPLDPILLQCFDTVGWVI